MSFDKIYYQHYHELRRFGHQFRISPEKIEDLIQETFLRFYLEVKKSVVFDNPRAWLYKVLLNLFKTNLAKEKRELKNSNYLKEEGDTSSDIQDEYIINEKQRIVYKMLRQLCEKEKTILLLYNMDFSYSEIAEIMDINPNSVGKMLVRTIKKLKNELKIHYHEMFE